MGVGVGVGTHSDRPWDRRTKRWASRSAIAGRGKGWWVGGGRLMVLGWRCWRWVGVQCRGVERKEWLAVGDDRTGREGRGGVYNGGGIGNPLFLRCTALHARCEL